jgi:hypothetical protein
VLRVIQGPKAEQLVPLVGVNVLNAFINLCEAQDGKALTSEQAEALIDKAELAVDLILAV